LISILAHVIGLLLEGWVWSDALVEDYKLNSRRKAVVAVPAFLTTTGFSAGMTCLAVFALANVT